MSARYSSSHISEIAEILATGLTRALARKSSGLSAEDADKAVDLERVRSGAVAKEMTDNAE
jgi:hypothetical protein